jgi:hypothetical protein
MPRLPSIAQPNQSYPKFHEVSPDAKEEKERAAEDAKRVFS